MEGIVSIGVSDDPNVSGGFEQLNRIRQVTQGITLQIDCSEGQLEMAIHNHSAPGNIVCMIREGVETVDHASRLMDRIRIYCSDH